LNLAAARLRHIAGTEWSTKRYLSMDLLKDPPDEKRHRLSPPRAPRPDPAQPRLKCEKFWTRPRLARTERRDGTGTIRIVTGYGKDSDGDWVEDATVLYEVPSAAAAARALDRLLETPRSG